MVEQFEPHYEKTCFLPMLKQLGGNHAADQHLCFAIYIDNTVPLLPISKISTL